MTPDTRYDLETLYRKALAYPGDIREHVPTLEAIAAKCNHVTEFGVRHGVSTTALLRGLKRGKGRKLVSYDAVKAPHVDLIAEAADGVEFEFHQEDTCTAEIAPTDCLFIDTWHVEEQLRVELARHSPKVRTLIVLHDTEVCGEKGENHGFRGLNYALKPFLARGTFEVAAHYPNCNGLTVLKRVKRENEAASLPGAPSPTRVYLGLPFLYDFCGQVPDSWDTAVDPHGVDEYQKWFTGGSMHCRNYNLLWSNCLNTRNLGWTHFGMIHADVRPYGYWLSTMLRTMREHSADLVSVVLPIKTEHGLTSTALRHRGTGRVRRLTMREVMRLPETFDAGAAAASLDWLAGDPDGWELLCSTGLWVCRFTEPWVERVWFEARDRIVYSPQDGFSAQNVSEDWAFSHALHRLGLKLAATRAVPCGHWGPAEYSNDAPWGTLETDTDDHPYGSWYSWQEAEGPCTVGSSDAPVGPHRVEP